MARVAHVATVRKRPAVHVRRHEVVRIAVVAQPARRLDPVGRDGQLGRWVEDRADDDLRQVRDAEAHRQCDDEQGHGAAQDGPARLCPPEHEIGERDHDQQGDDRQHDRRQDARQVIATQARHLRRPERVDQQDRQCAGERGDDHRADEGPIAAPRRDHRGDPDRGEDPERASHLSGSRSG